MIRRSTHARLTRAAQKRAHVAEAREILLAMMRENDLREIAAMHAEDRAVDAWRGCE